MFLLDEKKFRDSSSSKNAGAGFTLVELLVVVAMVGLIATIVLVNVANSRRKGRDAGIQSSLIEVAKVAEILFNNTYSYQGVCDAGDTYSTDFTSNVDFIIAGDHTDYLCAMAEDDAGNTSYLLVGQLNTDDTPPEIDDSTLAGDNSYLDIDFSEGIFGDSPADADDFKITFAKHGGNATDAAIAGVTKTDGDPLAGGETTIRVNLTITGTLTPRLFAIASSRRFSRDSADRPEVKTMLPLWM